MAAWASMLRNDLFYKGPFSFLPRNRTGLVLNRPARARTGTVAPRFYWLRFVLVTFRTGRVFCCVWDMVRRIRVVLELGPSHVSHTYWSLTGA